MDAQKRFDEAQARVKTLANTPDTSELLELYALYKQGTQGDAQGSRPGMFDIKGRAKWDAWATKKGTPRDAAMIAYAALVDRLAAK